MLHAIAKNVTSRKGILVFHIQNSLAKCIPNINLPSSIVLGFPRFSRKAPRQSPPPLPPRLILLIPMRHTLPNLRLTPIIHTSPRPTPRPSTPLHHTSPSRTPRIRLLIERKRAARRLHRIPPPLAHDTRAARRRWCTRAHVRAHGPLTAALGVARFGRRRPLDVVVCVWVFACELAFKTPERCFGQDFDRVGVSPFDAPVDFWVAGALAVGPVVDGKFVAVG